ncbi:unnamed protein product, partial [Polarella glacialis]
EPRPKCGSCGCPGFRYIPRRPEEVGEWWLPRRRGFDVRLWRANCKCGHSHEEHDSSSLRCRGCGCPSFSSAWECVSCEGKWQDHETLWESEEERRHCGRSVGQAFMPLSSTPEVQQIVLSKQQGPTSEASWSLPHKPRPERSVKLMQERCSHYGGSCGSRVISSSGVGSLEDAFPSRGQQPPGPRAFAALEDAASSRPPPGPLPGGGRSLVRPGSGAGSAREEAFPRRALDSRGSSGRRPDSGGPHPSASASAPRRPPRPVGPGG